MGTQTNPSDLAVRRRKVSESRKTRQLGFVKQNSREEEAEQTGTGGVEGRRRDLSLWLRTDLCLNETKILRSTRERKEILRSGRLNNSWSSHRSEKSSCSHQAEQKDLTITGDLGQSFHKCAASAIVN
jgi:hypothetical protein